ncbi:MAG: hypothetical protein ACREJU_10425 [Nitrospiraceae bacterium]
MPNEIIEKYQIAGLDERERGFSRLMDMERTDGRYRAVLRYEATMVATDACETPIAALERLIDALRERGYSQLKSRRNFCGDAYLGSREPWIEYTDPDRPSDLAIRPVTEQLARRTGWIGRVLKLFGG